MPANPGGELAINAKLQEIFWAIESLQPENFSGGSELRSLEGYIYRYFLSSGVYVAVRDDQIYLAGGEFGNQVIHAGSVDEIRLLVRSMQTN
jgi:hypothetical protein